MFKKLWLMSFPEEIDSADDYQINVWNNKLFSAYGEGSGCILIKMVD